MTAIVRTSGLTKRFGRAVALDRVDLQVARGECLGLVGSNGGGRTTLLRILATLVCPSSGTVEIGGIDAIRHMYEARSRLAYVGERSVPGFGLCVREYLEFVYASRRTKAGAGTVGNVDEVLERANLPPDAPVDDLSSGFRQRLALAAGFLIGPEVLILDDPFRAIDLCARPRFVEWLREVRNRGTTILVALYDEQDVAVLCHRVVQLEAGRLVQRVQLPEPEIPGVGFATLTAGEA
jgi:ABC-type multidrug transport system ATPase subunit